MLLAAMPGAAQDWHRTYGPGVVNHVVETPDGGLVAAAMAYSGVAPFGGSDGLLLKLSASGGVEWAVAMGGSYTDSLHGVAVLPDGYIAVGMTSSRLDRMLAVIRFDLQGAIRWQKTYCEVTTPAGRPILPSSDGAFYISALAAGSPNLFVIAKIDADGGVLWSRSVSAIVASQLLGEVPFVPTQSGGVVVLSTDGMRSPLRSRLTRLDAAGGVVWRFDYGAGPDSQAPLDLREWPDGSLLAAGWVGPWPEADQWMMRVDELGVPTWGTRFGSTSLDDLVYRVLPLAGADCLAFGHQFSTPDTGAWLSRLDAAGALVESFAIGLDIDHAEVSAGGILVAGGDGAIGEMALARLDASGRSTAPCATLTALTLDAFPLATDATTVADPVAPFTLLPVDATLAATRVALRAACGSVSCSPPECRGVTLVPSEPCAGEAVLASMDFAGGEGSVTISWNFDGDGVIDATGNPVSTVGLPPPWTIQATALDSCSLGAQACSVSLAVPVPAAPAEISDVVGGAPPLLVARSLDVVAETSRAGTHYNAYVGSIGDWYASDDAGGRRCAVAAWTDNGDGTITLPSALPTTGSAWILVTASNRCFEGSAGSDSMGRARATHPSWSACGPSP